MAKINISKIGVVEVEYKGRRISTLETGMRYSVIIIDGHSEEGIQTEIHFLNNGNCKPFIYDGVISFSKDWEIIKTVEFPLPYIPIKSTKD